MKHGFHDSESGIAYGCALATTVIIVLMGIWIVLAPVVDSLRDVTVDLNADSPDVFSDELVSRVSNVYEIWGMIVYTFIFVPVIFVIVRAIRRQGVD